MTHNNSTFTAPDMGMPCAAWQLRCFLLATAVTLLHAAQASATVLTFDIDVTSTGSPIANGGNMLTTHQGYGDNVNSLSTPGAPATTYNYLMGNGFTPNVTTTYSTSPGPLETWDGGGGVWAQSLYRGGGTVIGSTFFTLTPDNDFEVSINSFTLQGWSAGSPASNGVWRVRQNSTVGAILASGSWSVPAGNTTLMPFNTSSVGFFEGVLVLEIAQTGGAANSNGHLGMDNINFDQQAVLPVPEPGAFGLLAGGLSLATILRRRKRT